MNLRESKPNPLLTPVPKILPRFNKVVLLDDSDVDLFIHETILKAISIAKEVLKETQPVRLLEALRNTLLLSDVPELIFLDLNLPEMSGLEFLTEFNKLSDFVKNKCKIVVVTSSLDLDLKKKILLNPGVVRYLNKPLDVFQLKDFMEQ